MSIEMKCHKKSALYTMGYIQNNNVSDTFTLYSDEYHCLNTTRFCNHSYKTTNLTRYSQLAALLTKFSLYTEIFCLSFQRENL